MPACVFCDIVAGELPHSQVHEDERFLAFMDIYPWRPGHLLVIPKRHEQRVGGLAPGDAEALFGLGARIAAAVRRSGLPCDDIQFLLNDGPAANQTVPHVHLHVLPRTRGDLPLLLMQLARRPVIRLTRPAPRELLDEQARAIRSRL